MKLSKRSEYGLKALIELATYCGQGVVQAPQIARKHQISVKFLELILLDLRRAGILHDDLAASVKAEAAEAMREAIKAAEAEPPADVELLFANAYVDPPASFGSDLDELRGTLG